MQPETVKMKKIAVYLVIFFTMAITSAVNAQCSICTKTASQLGEKQGMGLNAGIIYLMLTPFAIGGYIGYRWWKNEKESQKNGEE